MREVLGEAGWVIGDLFDDLTDIRHRKIKGQFSTYYGPNFRTPAADDRVN